MDPDSIEVTFEPSLDSAPGYAQLRFAIDNAIPRMRDFWPTEPEHGSYSIHIVPGQGAGTKYNRVGRAAPTQTIEIGLDLLSQNVGGELRRLEFAPEDILLLTLAHETFHLTQNERIRASAGLQGWMWSGFAQSLEPSMSEEWRHAACALAAAYEDRKIMPRSVAKASDIVSELRADIRGLNALKRAKAPWADFAAALQSIRADDESAESTNYQTADAMSLVVTDRLPSEMDCLPKLWSLAFDQLASAGIGDELEKIIEEARPALHLDHFARSKPTPME